MDTFWDPTGPWPDTYKCGLKMLAGPRSTRTTAPTFVNFIVSVEVDSALVEVEVEARAKEDAAQREQRERERTFRLSKRRSGVGAAPVCYKYSPIRL